MESPTLSNDFIKGAIKKSQIPGSITKGSLIILKIHYLPVTAKYA